jgi:YVTN family beta-propeller protein
VQLSWTGSSSLDADGNYIVGRYSVLRRAGGGSYSVVGTTSGAPPAASYTDDTASAPLPSTTFYAVSGNTLESSYGGSAWSAVGTYSFGSEPNLIAATPDGQRVYVAESGPGGGQVLVVGSLYGSSGYDKVLATITLPGTNPDPVAVAMAPDGSAAYILDANNDQVDVVASPSSSTLVSATVPVGNVGDPAAMVVTPSSSEVLVANYNDGTVSVISAATASVSATVPLYQPGRRAPQPMGIAVLPSGADAYVVDRANSIVDEIALTGGSAGSVVGHVAVGGQGGTDTPADIGVAANTTTGPYVFVGDNANKTVDVISGTTVAHQLSVGGGAQRPTALAVAPDGCYVAALASSGGSSTVYLVNTSTFAVAAQPGVATPAVDVAVEGSSASWESADGAVAATPVEVSYEVQASQYQGGGGFASAYSQPLVISLGNGQAVGTSGTVTAGSPYNNVAISLDSNPSAANFDGAGYSYSATALANAGVGPGSTVSAAGFDFTWPDVPAGTADNWQAAGQVVPVSIPAGSSSLGVLGAASNGGTTGSSGTVVITYSDGSTVTETLSLPDWTLDGGAASLPGGAVEAVTTAYRNNPAGTDNSTTYVFATSLPIDPSKTVVSVTLPASVTVGQLHVFAFAGSSAGTTSAPFNNTGISADGAVGTANFDHDGYSYSANDLASQGVAPGSTITSGGFSFVWPNVATGSPDNWQAAGQTVAVSLPAGSSSLGILGSATNAGSTGSSGTVTVNYSDGTTSTATLSLPDWVVADGGALPAGTTTAVSLTYRNSAAGPQTVNNYVFATSVPVNPAKTVVSVTLPATVNTGQIHVFAFGA